MRAQTFLYEIQFRTTFIWSFFGCDAYFWQRWALRWMQFALSVKSNISTRSIFRAPSSTLGEGGKEIDIHAGGLFCTKFNSELLLFEAFLDVMRIFGRFSHFFIEMHILWHAFLSAVTGITIQGSLTTFLHVFYGASRI